MNKGLEEIETGAPILSCRSLLKTYDGKTHVLRNLDLDIRKGEFFTLLGPSGSGKTTLLMIIAGFEEPTGGTVLLAERDLHATPPYERNFGMVFQNYALFPHMNVAQNIAFPLRQRGYGRVEIAARIENAMRMVRLEKLDQRMPRQLSGGQQQRVALARALVFNPDVVLFDEPLGALDRRLRELMQLEIRSIHRELGVTMIYVTHDQEEALVLSDRIAVFDRGKIQQVGSPAEIYECPENSFVANFIGENNRVDGTVMAIDGDRCAVEIAGGQVVSALAVGDRSPGSPTTLAVRPENIMIDANAAAAPNRFGVTVMEKIYVGSKVRIRLKFADREDFIAETSAEQGQSLAIGQEVTAEWTMRHCRALDPVNRRRDQV